MTNRFLSMLLFCLCIVFAADMARADDKPQADATEASLLERVKENPDDEKLLLEYFTAEFGKIVPLIADDSEAALQGAAVLEASLNDIESTTDQAKTLLTRASKTIDYVREQVDLERTPLEQIIAELKENPSDEKAQDRFSSKVTSAVYAVVQADPPGAQQQLTQALAVVAELHETDDEDLKMSLDELVKGLASLERAIESAKRQLELIGADAAPLVVDTWISGEPLTDADLQGKVVLLDFWAVWCGPCIASFPHLREWHETYADKGLVIVGLTRYFNFVWDEESDGPAFAEEEVSHEAEQEMLAKFVKEHNLDHRIGVKTGKELAEFYAISSIPLIVVIDREGKIRMIQGGGEKAAEAIDKLLAELLP